MKSTRIDLDPERKIITHMIVSPQFLKNVAPLYRPEHLKAGYARMVADWCLEYWGVYKEAPGKQMQDIFKSKAKSIDEDDADNIRDFLSGLSKQWQEIESLNVEYAVSQAVIYLKSRALENLRDNIDEALTENDLARGEQFVGTFQRVEKPFGEGVSLLKDSQKVISSFMEDAEMLMSFPGALGEVTGPLRRGDFVAFLAPMKRGKTWWLWYLAETAMYAQLKTLFISLEMTEAQIIRRAWQSIVARPINSKNVTIPYFEAKEYDGEDQWIVKSKSEFREGVNAKIIKEQQAKYKMLFRGGDVRILSFPSARLTVEDLEIHLSNLETFENFVPDAIVIDYADLLLPGRTFRGDHRHGLNEIWMGLRRMAQERLCLVGTASQAEKSTFKEDASQMHVAEDVRKFAHVTGMWALNQSIKEEEQGIMRVAQLGVREGRRSFQQAVVLQSLDIGKPCLDSRLRNEVITDEEQEEKPTRNARPRRR